MYTDEQVFIQYVSETLQNNEQRNVALKILYFNKLISEKVFDTLMAKFPCENEPVLFKEQFTFPEDVANVFRYWCTVLNNEKNVERVDFFSLFDNRYDEGQITEICRACSNNTYVAALFSENLSSTRMKMINNLLEAVKDHAKNGKERENAEDACCMIASSKYNEAQAEEIYRAGSYYFELYYVKPERDADSLHVFRGAAMENLDMRPVAEYDYTAQQLVVIRDALREGVDLLYYCDETYTPEQMQEVYLGVLQDIDVGVYNDLKYDWEQMRQIRVGLKEGIDVSEYTTENLSAYYMEVLRLSMLNGEGLQFYGDSYEDPWDKRERGASYSIDNALETKRLQNMQLF